MYLLCSRLEEVNDDFGDLEFGELDLDISEEGLNFIDDHLTLERLQEFMIDETLDGEGELGEEFDDFGEQFRSLRPRMDQQWNQVLIHGLS